MDLILLVIITKVHIEDRENEYKEQFSVFSLNQYSDSTRNIGVGSFEETDNSRKLLIGTLMDVMH